METKYSGAFFRESLPKWKRKKEFFIARYLYRVPSYYISAFCANWGIKANTVSYFSAIVAVLGAGCFLVPNYYIHVVGALLVFLWSILDCVDGNLARSVEKQPFGVFADAMSSYILVGILCTTMGVAVYQEGGYLFKSGNVVIIILGAFASSADSLMRLIYQKYKNTEAELATQGVIQVEYDRRLDNSQTESWRVRLESWMGIDGVLNIFILIATIVNALDLAVLYCLLYYGGACVYSVCNIIRKAVRIAREHPFNK